MRGIDIDAPVSKQQMVQLRDLGYEVLGRYYRLDPNDPSALQQDEATFWLSEGGAILPIFEHSGRPEDGAAVGTAIIANAERVRQPMRTPVVVAADYDVPAADFPAWLAYLNDVINTVSIRRIPVWLYGPYDLLVQAAEPNWPAVAGLWRAYASLWSQGRNALDNAAFNVIQIANGVPFIGTTVDLDMWRSPARLWRA